LTDAIENITEGFSVYDSEDRLMICNNNYKEIYADVAELLTPGRVFGDLIDEDLRRRNIDPEEGANMKKALLEQHHACTGKPLVRQARDGRWIQSTDYRTSNGGLVGIRTDVTAYKNAESDLHEKKEEMELFNSVAVGRELRMIELKREINDLITQKGETKKYDIIE